MDKKSLIKEKLRFLSKLNEKEARHYVALWAIELEWGGVSEVNKLTGKSMTTIRKGIKEINSAEKLDEPNNIRKKGSGRKTLTSKRPEIIKNLELIMENDTSGDPMKHLKWTTKSTGNVADELKEKGYIISADTIGRLLKQENYSLKANRKSKESGSSPERDEQFKHINREVEKFTIGKEPVISVDTKKKELVGNFKNNGKIWSKKGQFQEVNVYDFPSLSKGKAIPYGAYDIIKNKGFVNVGVSSDTGEFAVESIRRWWQFNGKKDYPKAKKLLICADSGGSNGNRNKSWKYYLQKFVNETNLKITVCHYPPGTSKWNKIEHRMFSFISMNWKGKPLISYKSIISLINGTKTKKGLTIKAKIDKRIYKKGKKVSDEEFKKINLEYGIPSKLNYRISKN
ncbi:MAG: ISAzo13 family transposase [Nanoarchaeota archaeon]|nr:ISAzo13 family transposase [Nanoarchaeota archaeon]